MIEPTTKFNRRYKLKVEIQPRVPGSVNPSDANFVTIELPITCDFSVTRNIMASANTANFRIMNLAEDSRDKLYKDRYNLLEYRAIQFWAGYADNPPMIFNGNVKQAWSYKDSGSTTPVTEIEALESYAMVNGQSAKTLGGGQSYAEVIKSLNNDLPNLNAPTIGTVTGGSKRGVALFGNTWKLIQQYAGGANATIDNNRLLVLQPNECIEGDITVINADTGLLGSPYRADAILEFEMLFTPQLQIGQIVKLESGVNSLFNKFYKVIGFRHSGTISPSVSGDAARTLVQLWAGTKALTTI